MSNKGTPKSCSCKQCQYSKRSRHGHDQRRYEERAFRHSQKQSLKCGKGGYSPAPHGDYYS